MKTDNSLLKKIFSSLVRLKICPFKFFFLKHHLIQSLQGNLQIYHTEQKRLKYNNQNFIWLWINWYFLLFFLGTCDRPHRWRPILDWYEEQNHQLCVSQGWQPPISNIICIWTRLASRHSSRRMQKVCSIPTPNKDMY